MPWLPCLDLRFALRSFSCGNKIDSFFFGGGGLISCKAYTLASLLCRDGARGGGWGGRGGGRPGAWRESGAGLWGATRFPRLGAGVGVCRVLWLVEVVVTVMLLLLVLSWVISYAVGFVSRKRPFSTEAQIGLSYSQKVTFRLDLSVEKLSRKKLTRVFSTHRIAHPTKPTRPHIPGSTQQYHTTAPKLAWPTLPLLLAAS